MSVSTPIRMVGVSALARSAVPAAAEPSRHRLVMRIRVSPPSIASDYCAAGGMMRWTRNVPMCRANIS